MPEAVAVLEPMDPEELAVKLRHTLALWPAPERFDVTAEFYAEALEDLPADLVDKALKHVRMHYKYPSMPKPADFRAAVAGELGERQRVLGKLELALLKARRDGGKA